jgi:hypothetical protein
MAASIALQEAEVHLWPNGAPGKDFIGHVADAHMTADMINLLHPTAPPRCSPRRTHVRVFTTTFSNSQETTGSFHIHQRSEDGGGVHELR